MEIRAYLNFLQRRWKIIVPLFLATLAISTFLTMQIVPVYESSATYIVRISSSSDEKNSISALNTLISSDDIPATYAKVANSRLIKRQAADQLGLSSSQRSNLTSNSQLIAGTNVIEVSAKGDDPVIVMDYANEIGDQMLQYAATLYGTYELISLDEATQPRRPISPDIFTNLLLGAILGLSLGIAMALLVEYWQTSLQVTSPTHPLIAPRPEMLDNLRFEAEIEKALTAAQITGTPVSVAFLQVEFLENNNLSNNELEDWFSKVTKEFLGSLQASDRMCIFEDASIALYMPDTSEYLAESKMNEILGCLDRSSVLDGQAGKIRIRNLVGIFTYRGSYEQETLTAKQILDTAKDQMQRRSSGQTNKRRNKAIPITTSP
jgi:capsular polysaccharide biosynthesis protein